MMATRTREWKEGEEAFRQGVPETNCPYSPSNQWDEWAEWVCGHGRAKHDEWLKRNPEAV